jgi:uncharacterized protein (UPF0303 family)
MDSAALQQEYDKLWLAAFDEAAAWALGRDLVETALADALPVAINIRTADRVLFHASLPGAAPLNDRWIARKAATALAFQQPSLLVGTLHREGTGSLAMHGLDPLSHADHGGAVPVRVRGVGVVAVVTVSGLPQVEDHRMAVAALRRLGAGRQRA